MHVEHSNSPFTGESPHAETPGPIALRTRIPPSELKLIQGTDCRLRRATWAIGLLGTVILAVWQGWEWAAGFAVGAAASALSFLWMKSAVNLLSSAMSGDTAVPPRRQVSTVLRFMSRYALLGAIGYVIFLSSAISLKAFMAGLFVTVIALSVETVYEVWYEFKHGGKVD